MEIIAFITNPGLNIGPLEPSQIKAIYSGAVTNWNQVGGPDMPIVLLAPPPGGSPYLFFNNIFMTGTPFASTVNYINDTFDLAGRVANETGSIGFIRSGYLNRTDNVSAISIRNNSLSPAYAPTDFPAALNNSYVFSRNYYIYTNGPLKNGSSIWAHYILSKERGQKILAEYGFISLKDTGLKESRTHIESISDTPIDGYKVYRRDANGTINVFQTNETFFNDTSVRAGDTFNYSVSAMFSSGEGENTSILPVIIPKGNESRSSTAVASLPGFTGVIALGAIAILAFVALIMVSGRLSRRR